MVHTVANQTDPLILQDKFQIWLWASGSRLAEDLVLSTSWTLFFLLMADLMYYKLILFVSSGEYKGF